MISFEQARLIALEKIGPYNGLLDEYTIAKPLGWYFQYQSNAFLQTRDDRELYLSGCSFIVDRERGDIYEFGSLGSAERNLAAYAYGLRYEAMRPDDCPDLQPEEHSRFSHGRRQLRRPRIQSTTRCIREGLQRPLPSET